MAAPSAPCIANGCDNNWSTWWIGSRTQWNVTKDFYMGVDVLYSEAAERNVDKRPNVGRSGLPQSRRRHSPSSDEDNWSFRFRVHRDFYP